VEPHEIQKEGPIASVKPMVMHHAAIDIDFIEKCAWDNGARKPKTVTIKVNAFAGWLGRQKRR
jgi:hypothetical protein